jgi:hypothetical protein
MGTTVNARGQGRKAPGRMQQPTVYPLFSKNCSNRTPKEAAT